MNNDAFGFKHGDLETIIQTISQINGIKRVVIFGSRAKGKHQKGSDVDLALWTINDDASSQLSGVLNNETLLPYKFDVLNYSKVNNPDLIEQIDKNGVEIYLNQ